MLIPANLEPSKCTMNKRLFALILFWILAIQSSFCQRAVGNGWYVGRHGKEMFGSGGMNYRYDRSTGRYTKGHNTRKNLYGFWTDGSYSTFLINSDWVRKFAKGYAASFGFCYEYEHFQKINIQTGVGIRWQHVEHNVAEVNFLNKEVTDRAGYPFHVSYMFYDRQDFARSWYVQVPLLAGSYFRGFYYRGGLKFQLAVSGDTKINLRGTTVAYYQQYVGMYYGDGFTEMDNHGYRLDVPIKRKGEGLDIKPDILLSGEMGYEFGFGEGYLDNTRDVVKPDVRIRFALFADWGTLNINPKSRKDLCYIPSYYKWDFPEYQFNHVLSSDKVSDKYIHNFFAGIKVTVLVGVSLGERCVICHPFRSEVFYK